MLAQTLFLIAIVLSAVTAALGGIGAFARASLHDAAQTAARAGLDDAVAAYQAHVAAAIAADPGYRANAATLAALGGTAQYAALLPISALRDPASLPAMPVLTETIGDAVVRARVQPSAASVAPDCTSSGAPSLPDTAVALQCSRFVQESRLAVRVSVDVSAPSAGADAAPVARRSEIVTLRLFAQPPFTALVGAKDVDALAPGDGRADATFAHEADTGGFAGDLGPPAPATSGDTSLHVGYRCSGCPGVVPSVPYDADAVRDTPWKNGNGPSVTVPGP